MKKPEPALTVVALVLAMAIWWYVRFSGAV